MTICNPIAMRYHNPAEVSDCKWNHIRGEEGYSDPPITPIQISNLTNSFSATFILEDVI